MKGRGYAHRPVGERPKELVGLPVMNSGESPSPTELLVPLFKALKSGSIRSMSFCRANSACTLSRVIRENLASGAKPVLLINGPLFTGVLVVNAALLTAVLKRDLPVGTAAFTPRFTAELAARLLLKLPIGAAAAGANKPLWAELTKSRLLLTEVTIGSACSRVLCRFVSTADRSSSVKLVAVPVVFATLVPLRSRAEEPATNTGEGKMAVVEGTITG